MSLIKSAIMKTPLYPAARLAYQTVFRRDARIQKARMGAFYSQFFQVGDLVFDVGANLGEYSEVYANEGARVVAVEPNPAFKTRLMALARTCDIQPVFKAVSDVAGTEILNVCSEPAFSTLVKPGAYWMTQSPDYEGTNWTNAIEVPVTTLNYLANEFGEPEYVKIDVEGFEINVLKGMAFNPRYLSFEFGARRKKESQECLENLAARHYRFRPIVGRHFRFATSDWMTLGEASDWLAAFRVEQAEYGDMFAYR